EVRGNIFHERLFQAYNPMDSRQAVLFHLGKKKFRKIIGDLSGDNGTVKKNLAVKVSFGMDFFQIFVRRSEGKVILSFFVFQAGVHLAGQLPPFSLCSVHSPSSMFSSEISLLKMSCKSIKKEGRASSDARLCYFSNFLRKFKMSGDASSSGTLGSVSMVNSSGAC